MRRLVTARCASVLASLSATLAGAADPPSRVYVRARRRLGTGRGVAAVQVGDASADDDLGRAGSAMDQAEQAPVASGAPFGDAYFRLIFDGSGLGIALVDTEGRPIRCNPAMERILGYGGDELGRMAFPQFTHPDDVAADAELFQELIAGRRTQYQIEKRYVRKDGRSVVARLTVSLIAKGGKHTIAMLEDANVVESYVHTYEGSVTITNAAGAQMGCSALGWQQGYARYYRDDETALLYATYRYYDPDTGRFTAEDPIGRWGDAAGLGNGYAFLGNKYRDGFDPFGLRDPDDPRFTTSSTDFRASPDERAQAAREWKEHIRRENIRFAALQRERGAGEIEETAKIIAEYGPDWAKKALKEVEVWAIIPEKEWSHGKSVAWTPLGLSWYGVVRIREDHSRKCHLYEVYRRDLLRLMLHELRHVSVGWQWWLIEDEHQASRKPGGVAGSGYDAWTAEDIKEAEATRQRQSAAR